MIALTCPWCEEDALVLFTELDQGEAAFTCPDCGTTVTFAEEPAPALELAA